MPLPSQSAEPAFEVASIRPHNGPLHIEMTLTLSGPRAILDGYAVPQLIQEAYGLQGNWQLNLSAVSDRNALQTVYDIVAVAPEGTTLTKADARRRIQNLLADRFKLSIHHESKEVPGYALMAGKNSKLIPSGSTKPCLKLHAQPTEAYGKAFRQLAATVKC